MVLSHWSRQRLIIGPLVVSARMESLKEENGGVSVSRELESRGRPGAHTPATWLKESIENSVCICLGNPANSISVGLSSKSPSSIATTHQLTYVAFT